MRRIAFGMIVALLGLGCGGASTVDDERPVVDETPEPDGPGVSDNEPTTTVEAPDGELGDDGCYPGAEQKGTPYPDGRKVWCETDNGTKHGRYTLWFDGGKKGVEGIYKNGKLHGMWTRRYEEAGMQSQVAYKNGRNQGSFHRWYENGNDKQTGQYIDGKEDGTWKHYNEDGSLDKTEMWKLGRLVEPAP